MQSKNKNEQNTIAGHRTSDGLIEITSLELLDSLVGGFLNPEEVYCQVNDNEYEMEIDNNKEGIS